MIDLIAKLNAAERPDGHLNAMIWLRLVAPHLPGNWTTPDGVAPDPYYALNCPNYTGSIDSALTLLPDGVEVIDLRLSWDTSKERGHPACSIRWYEPAGKGNDWKALSVSAKTIPLTVCLAAMMLRSRNAFTNSDSGPLDKCPPPNAASLEDPGADARSVSASAPGRSLEAT